MASKRVLIRVPRPSSANRHKVPVQQWKRWTKQQRRVFNEMYGTLKGNGRHFRHPAQSNVVHEHWLTVCWNAAWTAADAVARCAD